MSHLSIRASREGIWRWKEGKERKEECSQVCSNNILLCAYTKMSCKLFNSVACGKKISSKPVRVVFRIAFTTSILHYLSLLTAYICSLQITVLKNRTQASV